MVEPLLLIIIVLLLIIVALVIFIAITFSISQPVCSVGRNFELEFLQKVKDPLFLNRLEENPKRVLEEEISRYTGETFQFSDNVNVKVLQEDPNDLYLLIPPEEGLPNDGNSPLEQVLNVLDEKETYGLFMSYLENIWWRLGVSPGSCIADIKREIQIINSRKCLSCS